MDPFEQFNDNDLWRALEDVELKSFVEEMNGMFVKSKMISQWNLLFYYLSLRHLFNFRRPPVCCHRGRKQSKCRTAAASLFGTSNLEAEQNPNPR